MPQRRQDNPATRLGASGAGTATGALTTQLPPAQPVAAASHTAAMAGVDAARCATAAKELAEDAWALAAMGDHALCLIDAGKLDEAKNRLDQLGAITPRDWRVALGRAVLAETADTTRSRRAYQAGLWFALVPDRLELDVSVGGEARDFRRSRYWTVGLRVTTPPFLK